MRSREMLDFSKTYHVVSIQVVNISVFPVIMMYSVLVHGDLRAVKDRRFVHVVPSEQAGRWALVILVG